MISSFDIEKLQSLLKDFYTISHIRITVFDENFRELLSYPEHLPDFCRLIRQTDTGKLRCQDCDKTACSIARRQHDTYIYKCHAGLTEAISSIFLGNIAIGYLLFGHVFSYDSYDEGWEIIKEQCRNLPVELCRLQSCSRELPIMSESYIRSASNLLHAVAAYLCMERMLLLRRNNLPLQLDNYIHDHLDEPLSAEILCKELQIGKTYLYEISKQNYGCGIAEQIRNLRIEKAKVLLLEHPGLSISEVATTCGFEDYNYFITIFKKQTGMTPRHFRLN